MARGGCARRRKEAEQTFSSCQDYIYILLLALPDDLQAFVLRKLSVQMLGRSICSCKTWQHIVAQRDDVIWKHLVEHMCPGEAARGGALAAIGLTWKRRLQVHLPARRREPIHAALKMHEAYNFYFEIQRRRRNQNAMRNFSMQVEIDMQHAAEEEHGLRFKSKLDLSLLAAVGFKPTHFALYAQRKADGSIVNVLNFKRTKSYLHRYAGGGDWGYTWGQPLKLRPVLQAHIELMHGVHQADTEAFSSSAAIDFGRYDAEYEMALEVANSLDSKCYEGTSLTPVDVAEIMVSNGIWQYPDALRAGAEKLDRLPWNWKDFHLEVYIQGSGDSRSSDELLRCLESHDTEWVL